MYINIYGQIGGGGKVGGFGKGYALVGFGLVISTRIGRAMAQMKAQEVF